jgi:hypothetical protein
LQPSTGGTFVVEIVYLPPDAPAQTSTGHDNDRAKAVQHRVLWDRKVDGGFPETKELKRRVRDAIEPGRNLGHVDRDHARPVPSNPAPPTEAQEQKQTDAQAQTQPQAQIPAPTRTPGTGDAVITGGEDCEDCK